MHHPQILVLEADGRLAAQLRPTAAAHKWLLREPRHLHACVRLLRHAEPGVVVVRIGRHLEHEFALLEQIAWLFPRVGRVVSGDSDHAWLAGLAWDLGADFVHLPPMPRDLLTEVVVGLMTGAPIVESA
jgi:hypothetical protein